MLVFCLPQPDIYPGNCWAFKGSQGYLVVRLSMEIHPTSFTLEHIPKTLSPTGNITSAPKDFSVYVSVPSSLPTRLWSVRYRQRGPSGGTVASQWWRNISLTGKELRTPRTNCPGGSLAEPWSPR